MRCFRRIVRVPMRSSCAAGSATEDKRILAGAAMAMFVIGVFYDLASTPSPLATLALSMVFEGGSIAISVRALRASRSIWKMAFTAQAIGASVVLIDGLGRLLLKVSLIGLLIEGRP